MAAQIAIFGARVDGHVARVGAALAELGVRTVLLDPEHDRSCAITIDGKSCATHFKGVDPISGEPETTEGVAFYWLRNKKRYTHALTKQDQQAQFTILEMSSAVMADIKINGYRTHNSYAAVIYHENKAYQLSLARKVGLSIPRTLIANDPAAIVHFVQTSKIDRLAVKALANVYLPPPFSDPSDDLLIYTQLVSADELLAADPDEFRGPPFILQEYIEKEFEVRLVMFDGEVLSYAIQSQSVPSAAVDWRLADEDPVTHLIETPPDIRLQCAEYLKLANLNYGAFDFCVKPDGSWFFLECNSEGQWGWLEGPDREISKMFAEQFKRLAAG